MRVEPFTSLSWAFRLHYYVCFRTYHRQELFRAADRAKFLSDLIGEICSRHDYHLLQQKVYPNHVRLLVSIRPAHTVSKLVQTLRANCSREFCTRFDLSTTPWARGYLARSVGRITIDGVRRYLADQPVHHGYASRALPPVYRYRAPSPVELSTAHASFELSYHLVFSTPFRIGVFGSQLGEAVGQYWLKVAAKHNFAVDQVSVVPDHVHLLVRTKPNLSIESCALALLNDSQHFVVNRFPGSLIEVGANNLWVAGAYAGTCGRVSTAQVKAFLSRED